MGLLWFMAIEANSPTDTVIGSWQRDVAARNECELTTVNCPVVGLRDVLAREEALLRQKDELILQLELLSKEADHRLLNNMQMVASLLSLQSRTCANVEAASQLDIAANRVATIERVHRRLHSLDGTQVVAFKQYLEDFCRDFSTLVLSKEGAERDIIVRGTEISLPVATGIPLGFIANELITNAAKYGNGRILVTLEPEPTKGWALSVFNDGPALPDGFDPETGKGMGMKIITSFIRRISGTLLFGRGDENQGARFTVLFS
jgi:two-component sensor histidine kinase